MKQEKERSAKSNRRAVMSLYDGATIRVRLGSARLDEFKVKVGLNQESVPVLFTIVVDVITDTF